MAKAKANDAAGPRLERQLFYAHLYLGLWYEAKKDFKLRDKYIGHAAAVADRTATWATSPACTPC